MSTETSDVVVDDDTENHRFVARIDGEVVGFAVYHQTAGARLFVHTEVDDSQQGKGVASALMRGALDDMKEKDMTVVPLCPYVRRWIGEHDEYQSLIDDDLDRALRP